MGRDHLLSPASDDVLSSRDVPSSDDADIERFPADIERKRRLAFARILSDSRLDADRYVEGYVAGRGAE